MISLNDGCVGFKTTLEKRGGDGKQGWPLLDTLMATVSIERESAPYASPDVSLPEPKLRSLDFELLLSIVENFLTDFFRKPDVPPRELDFPTPRGNGKFTKWFLWK